jgi:hypothetical protein
MMKPQITITKQTDLTTETSTLFVHVSASKDDTLELLACGAKNIMDSMGITVIEFLESLMNVGEFSNICRTVIDTSLLAQLSDEN